MNVTEIRAKFPNPVAVGTCFGETDRYCVGGAAIRALTGKHTRFPQPAEIAEAVCCHVGEAADISRANDAGNFERAWQLLDEALKSAAQSR